MGKIYCSECGVELDDSVKFCSSCGANLETTEISNSQSNDFIQSFEILPIIVSLLVSIVGAYILNSLNLRFPYLIIFITISAMLIGFLAHKEIKFVMSYSLIVGVILGFSMVILRISEGLSALIGVIILTMLGSFIGYFIKVKLNFNF